MSFEPSLGDVMRRRWWLPMFAGGGRVPKLARVTGLDRSSLTGDLLAVRMCAEDGTPIRAEWSRRFGAMGFKVVAGSGPTEGAGE